MKKKKELFDLDNVHFSGDLSPLRDGNNQQCNSFIDR